MLNHGFYSSGNKAAFFEKYSNQSYKMAICVTIVIKIVVIRQKKENIMKQNVANRMFSFTNFTILTLLIVVKTE